MNLIASAIRTVERSPLPDPVTRTGIDFLVGRTCRNLLGRNLLESPAAREQAFVHAMAGHPIAAAAQDWERQAGREQ